MNKNTISHSGFTLIELVVAVTILALIMVSVFTIYTNLLNVNRKLEQTRILQENTRMITEKIATDVRENGIEYSTCPGFDIPPNNPNACLQVKRMGGTNRYYIAKKIADNRWHDSSSGSIILDDGTNQVRLTDEEVTVKNLSFITSGTSASGTTNQLFEGKVQMVFDIGLTAGKGVSSAVANSSFITVQTTISEKIYKGN